MVLPFRGPARSHSPRTCILRILPLLLWGLIGISDDSLAQQMPPSLVAEIADLQKSPTDTALRLKIIRHVQGLKRAPAVTEEAHQHCVEGNALLRKALKAQRGYDLAVEPYQQCLLLAPWLGDAYNNLAIALEMAEKYDEAKDALQIYIATQPGDEETRKAQDKIYELGALKKFANQDKATTAAAAPPPPSPVEQLVRRIEGARFTYPVNDVVNVIDIRGGVMVNGIIDQGAYSEWTGEAGRVEIAGPETTVRVYQHAEFQKVWITSIIFIISPDGERITRRTFWNDGDTVDYIYFRQR